MLLLLLFVGRRRRGRSFPYPPPRHCRHRYWSETISHKELCRAQLAVVRILQIGAFLHLC